MKLQRNLILYMLGRLISYIGTGIQQIALPLYVLDLTHSGTMMGVVSLCSLLPNIIAAPFSGIIGDRKNRRIVMVLTDAGRGILVCALGIMAMTKGLNIGIILIVQVLVSMMDSIFGASSSALLPELVDGEELMKATSARGGIDAFSMIIGPISGGVLYGLLGIKAIFLINGISFIASGICSLFITYQSKTQVSSKMTVKTFISENGEAMRFIKSNKGLMQLFTFAMISNLLVAPLFDVVMPFVLKKGIGFSSVQYSYIMTGFTIGILLGNIVIGMNTKKIRTKSLMKCSLIFEAIMMLGIAVVLLPNAVKSLGGHSLLLLIALIAIIIFIGTANAGVNTPIGTNLQKMVPNEMRSRFFSLLGIFSMGATPLGAMIYGLLLDKFQYHLILLVVMALNAIVTAVFIINAVPEVYDPVMAEPSAENLDGAAV